MNCKTDKPVNIVSCGYVDASGFGGRLSQTCWADTPGGEKSLRWSLFKRAPFDRFGRLDNLSKHVVAAVEMLGLPICPEKPADPDVGIVLGTGEGSLEVDVNFIKSIDQVGGASPRLFTYTVPSAAIAEVAIRYRLGGPNYCIMSADSAAGALWQSLCLLNQGEARRCVCLCSDATGEISPSRADFAYAFLMETASSPADNCADCLGQMRINTAETSSPCEFDEIPGRLTDYLLHRTSDTTLSLPLPTTFQHGVLTVDRC